MIKFEEIVKIYPPNIVALKNISFDVQSGEFVCIVGKSGVGKTTLLKLLLAIEKPTAGKILFEKKEVSKFGPEDFPKFRRNIGVVFQDYKLLSAKTVFENVAYVMELRGWGDKEIRKDVFEILDIVGLGDRMRNFPDQLSGGEKQRVAIARAIAHRPRLILADEPTGNLDPYYTQEMMRLFTRINETGTTIILATHDKDVIDDLRKRVVTLEDGIVIRDEKSGQFVL